VVGNGSGTHELYYQYRKAEMEKSKWLHLLVSVGLPFIGLVLQYLAPHALEAMCYPLKLQNPTLPISEDRGK
jgi:hypothetical protein